MKKILIKLLIFVQIFSLVCPYITFAKKSDDDIKFSKKIHFNFFEDICIEDELEFLIDGNNLYVDGEAFLENLGFEGILKHGDQLDFYSKGRATQKKDRDVQKKDDDKNPDINDFSMMNISGTFFFDKDDVYFSNTSPKVLELKSPCKAIYRYDKAWIPFKFTIDLLNLSFDESSYDETFDIKIKEPSRLDIILANKYLLESPKTFNWKDIYGDEASKLFKNSFIIMYLDRILDKDFLDTLEWTRTGVGDALKSMILFKDNSKFDAELFADATEAGLQALEMLTNIKSLKFLRELFSGLEKKGWSKDVINANYDDCMIFVKTVYEGIVLKKNTDPEINQVFASYYKNKVDNSRLDNKNNIDYLAYTILKKDFVCNNLYNKLPDIVDVIKNCKTKTDNLKVKEELNEAFKGIEKKSSKELKGVDFDGSEYLDFAHKLLKILAKKQFDAAEAFQTGTYSNLLAESMRLDFINCYYDIDIKYLNKEYMTKLSNLFYLSLISKYTTNNYIIKTLFIDRVLNRDNYEATKKIKDNYQKENKEILKVIDAFEKAKAYDEEWKYNYNTSITNPKFNKDYIEGYDDSELIAKILEELENDKAVEVKYEYSRDDKFEIMEIYGLNKNGDRVWNKKYYYDLGQAQALTFMFSKDDYFYYRHDKGLVKAKISDGSIIWENYDVGAIIDWVEGEDGTLYITTGLVPEFTAVNKDGKTLKLINRFSEDYVIFWPGDIVLKNNKLYIEFWGPDKYSVDHYVLEMSLPDFSYTLPGEEENTSTAETYDNSNPFYDLINKHYSSDYVDCNYAYVDIDDDGDNELVIHTGTCEGDRKYEVYKEKNGKAVYLGKIPGWHSALYKYGNKLQLVNGESEFGEYFFIAIDNSNNTLKFSEKFHFDRFKEEIDEGEVLRFTDMPNWSRR